MKKKKRIAETLTKKLGKMRKGKKHVIYIGTTTMREEMLQRRQRAVKPVREM